MQGVRVCACAATVQARAWWKVGMAQVGVMVGGGWERQGPAGSRWK